jgi:hypothetical protein
VKLCREAARLAAAVANKMQLTASSINALPCKNTTDSERRRKTFYENHEKMNSKRAALINDKSQVHPETLSAFG